MAPPQPGFTFRFACIPAGVVIVADVVDVVDVVVVLDIIIVVNTFVVDVIMPSSSWMPPSS